MAAGSTTANFWFSSKVAGNYTITASATSYTNGTDEITVNPGSPVKLQVLMPYESADPGTVKGKKFNDEPADSSVVAGVELTVTIRAVDTFWNVVTYTPSSTPASFVVTISDANGTITSPTALLHLMVHHQRV